MAGRKAAAGYCRDIGGIAGYLFHIFGGVLRRDMTVTVFVTDLRDMALHYLSLNTGLPPEDEG